MGQAVCRLGDTSAGHDGFPPRPNDAASTNVFANGIGVHRVGDHWPTHCNPVVCHDAVQAQGSSSVFVNGVAVARIGDEISCGDVVAQGSPNVFIG